MPHARQPRSRHPCGDLQAVKTIHDSVGSFRGIRSNKSSVIYSQPPPRVRVRAIVPFASLKVCIIYIQHQCSTRYVPLVPGVLARAASQLRQMVSYLQHTHFTLGANFAAEKCEKLLAASKWGKAFNVKAITLFRSPFWPSLRLVGRCKRLVLPRLTSVKASITAELTTASIFFCFLYRSHFFPVILSNNGILIFPRELVASSNELSELTSEESFVSQGDAK